MAEKTVDDLLKSLLERDLDELDDKQSKLKTLIYAFAPSTLEYVAELTGIEPTQLIRYAVRTSWNENRKWYEVIETIRTFYQYKRNDEEGEREEQGNGYCTT